MTTTKYMLKWKLQLECTCVNKKIFINTGNHEVNIQMRYNLRWRPVCASQETHLCMQYHVVLKLLAWMWYMSKLFAQLLTYKHIVYLTWKTKNKRKFDSVHVLNMYIRLSVFMQYVSKWYQELVVVHWTQCSISKCRPFTTRRPRCLVILRRLKDFDAKSGVMLHADRILWTSFSRG